MRSCLSHRQRHFATLKRPPQRTLNPTLKVKVNANVKMSSEASESKQFIAPRRAAQKSLPLVERIKDEENLQKKMLICNEVVVVVVVVGCVCVCHDNDFCCNVFKG